MIVIRRAHPPCPPPWTLALALAAIVPAAATVPGSASASASAPAIAGDRRPAAASASAPGSGPAVAPAIPAANQAAADPTVEVTFDKPALTLGVDTGSTLRIAVRGAGSADARIGRVLATVGTVEAAIAVAGKPGTFAAVYRLPGDRFPQAALIVVEALLGNGRSVFGAARALLAAPTEIPLRTSPRADVTVSVAGRVFGPRRADAEGRVRLPLVVPPGVPSGLARASDRFGNLNETPVDLQPVDYPRTLVIAPGEGEVGTAAAVTVWGVTMGGDPAPAGEIDLRSSGGQVDRAGGDSGGAAMFTVTLPTAVGSGALALSGTVAGVVTGRPHALTVRPGPPAMLTISSSSRSLVVGSGATTTLTVGARDRFGNRAPALGAAITADGSPLAMETSDTSPHTINARIAAPARWPGRHRILVAAVLGTLRAEASMELAGAAPARVAFAEHHRLRVLGDGQRSVDLTLEVSDHQGTPTAAPELTWTADGGTIQSLGSTRYGTYLARFVPARARRDHTVMVTATFAPGQSVSTRVAVEAVPAPAAIARIGIVSNLGDLFGPAVFVEGLAPLPRLGRVGRLVSAGVSLGYLHGQIGTARAQVVPGVHVDVDQVPLQAMARVRLPADLPVEFSLSGSAGVTFAATQIAASEGADRTISRAGARGVVLGTGIDAALLLHPGELVVGARYLRIELGPTSDGDRIRGNTAGLICDLGFKLGF